jgi:hypothetical protein
MKTTGWNVYYKTDDKDGTFTTTQMCYEPLVSPDGSIFCMNFTYPSEYQLQQQRLNYTKKFVDLAFNREVEFLTKFLDYPWSPKLLKIENNKIFFIWHGATCNDVVFRYHTLENYPFWRTQLKKIILDQINAGVYKATVYPHSHYFDNEGNMHAFDFYASAMIQDPYISFEDVKCLISNKKRFIEATEDTVINIETLFKSGLLEWSQWPGNLPDLYEEIFYDNHRD